MPPKAGVVDDDVEAAVGVLGEREEGLDLLLVGDVAGQGGDAVRAELGGERLLGLLQAAGVGVADDDAGALLQEAAGGGSADPGPGGRGDDGGAVLQQTVPGDIVGGGHARTSLGRPRIRSAMRLRWISSEPA